MKSHRWNIKLLRRHLTVVEGEVFTHVSIHVRLLRDIMSKNCFLLAPLIKFNLLTQTINLCQRFKKRLRHLTVVEVEVFTIVLCAQSLEDAQYMQLRLLRNIIYKNCFIYAHIKIQLQSANSKSNSKSTWTPEIWQWCRWRGFHLVLMLNTCKTVKRCNF